MYELPHWSRPPFLISLSAFPDETAEAAQVVLPDHTGLERWESAAAGGVRSVAAPAVPPLYDTRDAADTLIALAAKAGKPLPFETWEKAIEGSFASSDTYKAALERGGEWGGAAPAFTFATASKKFDFAPAGLPALEPPKWEGDGLLLHVYESVLGTGEAANLPWLQELPDTMSQAVWTTLAELNPQTAAKMGIGAGDRVDVSSSRGRMQARAALSPAVPPDSVVIAAGQGHTAFGRYARNRGGNVLALVDPERWASTRVRVQKL